LPNQLLDYLLVAVNAREPGEFLLHPGNTQKLCKESIPGKKQRVSASPLEYIFYTTLVASGIRKFVS